MKMYNITRAFYLIKRSDDDLTVDQRKWTLVVPGTKEQYKNYMTKFHCLLSPAQSLSKLPESVQSVVELGCFQTERLMLISISIKIAVLPQTIKILYQQLSSLIKFSS